MTNENEGVEAKLDRLNSVIHHLIEDDEKSQLQSMRSIYVSMSEDLDDFPLGESINYMDIPQEYLDKIQEVLTDYDRLSMRYDDLYSEVIRKQSATTEAILNKDQLQKLYSIIGNALESQESTMFFRINKSFLEAGNETRVAEDIYNKYYSLESEIISLRSQILEFSTKDFSRVPEKSVKNVFSVNDVNAIDYSKKLQEVYKAEEEIAQKKVKLQFLENEYIKKIDGKDT